MRDRTYWLGGWSIRFGPFGSALALAIAFGLIAVVLAVVGIVVVAGDEPLGWWLIGSAAVAFLIAVVAVVFTVRIAIDERRRTYRSMSSETMLGLIVAIIGGAIAVGTGIALVVVALLGGFAEHP